MRQGCVLFGLPVWLRQRIHKSSRCMRLLTCKEELSFQLPGRTIWLDGSAKSGETFLSTSVFSAHRGKKDRGSGPMDLRPTRGFVADAADLSPGAAGPWQSREEKLDKGRRGLPARAVQIHR